MFGFKVGFSDFQVGVSAGGKRQIISVKHSVKKAKIPEGISVIKSYNFVDCNKLKSVILSSGVLKIEDNAFSGKSTLESVTLNNGLTSIGAWAFQNTGIKEIVIPASVTQIQNNAFDGCVGLTINFQGSEEQWQRVLAPTHKYGASPAGMLDQIDNPKLFKHHPLLDKMPTQPVIDAGVDDMYITDEFIEYIIDAETKTVEYLIEGAIEREIKEKPPIIYGPVDTEKIKKEVINQRLTSLRGKYHVFDTTFKVPEGCTVNCNYTGK